MNTFKQTIFIFNSSVFYVFVSAFIFFYFFAQIFPETPFVPVAKNRTTV